MRIAHATDIHWFRPPFGRPSAKRMLGSLNLYLRGRKSHFDEAVQSALVAKLVALEPDVALITGDLTATALPEEFDAARQALDPLLRQVPTFVIPGNHDVYTQGAMRAQRIRDRFAAYMGLDEHGLGHFSAPGVTVIGLDPNRAHLLASGVVPDAQLAALPAALEAAPADDFVILALHYPVLSRRGEVYDGWEHGLRNSAELIEVLRGSSRRPDLIVHGHKHHGFQVDLDLGDAVVPIYNPGSSGYAYIPDEDRAACFNVYDVRDGALHGVERYRYGADGFAPEEGGAYASGR